MTCDVSNQGLAAVLYQHQNDIDMVKIHSRKLEFLALKWAVIERFSDYLHHGLTLQVFMDNNPLMYVLTSGKLNAVGMENTDTDYLSRPPLDIQS